jgi:hypothetical protein
MEIDSDGILAVVNLERSLRDVTTHRDDLLKAIEEHRALREQHPKGPSKRNQKLWATATRIEEEAGK